MGVRSDQQSGGVGERERTAAETQRSVITDVDRTGVRATVRKIERAHIEVQRAIVHERDAQCRRAGAIFFIGAVVREGERSAKREIDAARCKVVERRAARVSKGAATTCAQLAYLPV